jgi:hypothetical protein
MLNQSDRLEVWLGAKLLLAMDSSHSPAVGELINIKKATYKVVGRSFTVDRADNISLRQVRCNVIVEAL